MGPTWVLSASDGPHDGPMNLAIRAVLLNFVEFSHYEWNISIVIVMIGEDHQDDFSGYDYNRVKVMWSNFEQMMTSSVAYHGLMI